MTNKKTVIIDYAKISPAVLEYIIRKFFTQCYCTWSDIDEDHFEFSVYNCSDLAMLENLLAKYV